MADDAEPPGSNVQRTPDGRYIIVRGRLWRATNPNLPEEERQRWVNALMDARRAVKAAKASGDDAELKSARAQVQEAKVALGERGPVWWDDGAPDYNRKMVENTPYASWWATQKSSSNSG
ncbi:hypothetical protein ACFCW2_07740 [Qipengyuania sp. DSG2-2]|uniref:hypothetical protein n=1 Tax=Qipengyuania sp. DGS2-2 TaxID=3349631 RepID=UPI0036D36EE1